MSDYQPEKIELEAQAHWEAQKSFDTSDSSDRPKFYCLSMMPYPSGDLHMGHVRNYTIGDVISRYQRMRGHQVMQPMCWDAFGLPAENAAIKHKVTPNEWTKKNIANMKQQMKRFGLGYDWQREFSTCDPEYYRWNQWLFLKMHELGLAYRKEATVNWDPVDQTVLANEQVIDGKGWRSGAPIERRKIPQWFLKITHYADQLLDDLDQLEHWPERVKTMQRNWIGRSHGVNIRFQITDREEIIEVYTTRIDTLFGASFMVVAAQHPLAQAAAQHNPDIAQFIESCSHLTTAEADLAQLDKEGFDTGFTAINPVNNEAIPVWVANYIIMDYGTGAVMAVPAHDQRDHEFATKYQLPIIPVIQPSEDKDWDYNTSAFSGEGILINSSQFNGLEKQPGIDAIADFLTEKGCADRVTEYRLRNWGVSRQRYWGTPIPMIYCTDCGAVPVPEDQLPVILPTDVKFDGTQSPLKALANFINVDCPNCGNAAQRETDTFDTFIDSSWYYARLACPDQDSSILDKRANHWLPVDQYIGGIEHAILHLLYARFIHKVLRDLKLITSDEPFSRLLSQGMVLKDGNKMSKSKGNIVAPMPLIEKYGADTLRLFMIFTSAPEQSLEWNDSAVEGAQRFLKRIWQYCHDHEAALIVPTEIETTPIAVKARQNIHHHLKKANYDMQRQQYNTVVSAAMKIMNELTELEAAPGVSRECISILLRLLAPITPHICHVLWQKLALNTGDILDQPWPEANSDALQTDQISLVIQVNGKRRSEIEINANADQAEIETAVLQNRHVQRYLNDQPPRKIIIVAGKLVNVVV